MSEKNKDNHVYARNIKGEERYIMHPDVIRGRKGYRCIGCDEEMEARKGPKLQYFAHVPTDVKNGRKCTFSNETYRHKIAKEILQILKR